MYKKILAPLDGSDLAECVLPHVEKIAASCETEEVVLVSVTEGEVRYKPSDYAQPLGGIPRRETVGKEERQAHRYLNRIAKGLVLKGIKLSSEVLIGNPAWEIVSYVEHNDIDLIVMASHGRSGPSRWAHGSVADKVFRASCVPVLMVRAPGCVIST